MKNTAHAREIVAETISSLQQFPGALSATVALPAPFGAAEVFVTGEVHVPGSGVSIPELSATTWHNAPEGFEVPS